MPKAVATSQTSGGLLANKITRTRTMIFMGALFLVLAGSIILGGYLVLKTTRANRLDDLDRQMLSHGQTVVTNINLWFGNAQKNMQSFAATDTVRLYATTLTAKEAIPPDDAARQSRAIRSQLDESVQKNNFLSAALFVDTQSPHLVVGDAPPLNAAQDIAHVYEKRASLVRPVRIGSNHTAVLDVLVPIFIPQYLMAQGTACVGVLWVTLDVQEYITPKILDNFGEIIYVVQEDNSALFSMPLKNRASIPLGVQWKNPGEEPSALIEQDFVLAQTTDSRVYAHVIPIPNIPWVVVPTLPVSIFEEGYADFRHSVVIASTLVILLVGLILFMIWWRLFARQEAQTAQELQQLYTTVQRQKQLIEGINTSVEAGIVLCGKDGRIAYANAAFARMAGETPEHLLRRSCNALISAELGQHLHTHVQWALENPQKFPCMVNMVLQGEQRTYQARYTPFLSHAGENKDAGLVFVYRDVTDILRMQQRQSNMLNNMILAFVHAVEATDTYLHGHSERMQKLAYVLAEQTGLQALKPTLNMAAQLSQIGMIRLPRRLFTKTGAFDAEERHQLEQHVSYALEAIHDIDFGLPVQQALAHMCERMDGSGYPAKLTGYDICMAGRILGLVSTCCAMLRPRGYRQGLSLDQTLERLQKDAPKFDATLLKTLVQFLQSNAGKEFTQSLK